jgi:hypothetical protein
MADVQTSEVDANILQSTWDLEVLYADKLQRMNSF